MNTEPVTTVTTVSQLLEDMARQLNVRGVAEPYSEAREIVSALFDVPRFWPLMNGGVELEADMQSRARTAVSRRLQGAPVAYAVGRASFRHLTLDVDERVLIPRPETEQLVDLVLEFMGDAEGGVAIDVGTGSGAIAIALASEGRFTRVYATDISLGAVAVARGNAELCKAVMRAPLEVLHGSLLAPVADLRARVIVSNPPYIAHGEAQSLPANVRDWEPAVALYSGSDGMSATTRLIGQAADVLLPGGLMAIEVDVRRASLAAELVSREERFHAIRVELDHTGRERFVLARRRDS